MVEPYDIIVIGAGHNGLAAALDLARRGLSVLVIESQRSAGGRATTAEPLLPGFRHSPHANTFIFADIMPDLLAPTALGLRLCHPEAQLGVAFADGRPPVILHRPDLLARTRASFRVYSKRDAATYVDLKRRSDRFGALIRRGLYNAPDPEWFVTQSNAVRTAFKGRVDTRSLGQGSALSLIDGLFEAPEIRILLYHLATETGLGLKERGGDIAFLGYSLWIAGRWRIPVGGMGTYVQALWDAAVAAGVRVLCSAPVTRIIVEGGRAVGVATEAGMTFHASRGVLAATSILDTFDLMPGFDAITPTERNELRALRRQRPASIATSLFCMEGAPHYKSAEHDPQINACLKTVIGHDASEDVVAHATDVGAGLLPKPAGVVRVHSLWDPSLAPEGQHVVGVDSSFPSTSHIDPESLQMIEAAFPQAFLDIWNGCRADALVRPLAMATDLSAPFERRMLLRMGSDQYRTSVPGLFLGGPGCYPGGGVHGACGLNAARTIHDDIGRYEF